MIDPIFRDKLQHGCESSNPLAKHYRSFNVENRILLTGHSHQAWPDCAREAVLEAFDDAACHVDEKWGRASNKADEVRRGFAKRLDDTTGDYVLGQNVHELFVRWISGIDSLWSDQPRAILTTDGEFHSVRRQIDRFEELKIPVHRVAMSESESVVPRLIDAILASKDPFGAVVVSAVGFLTGVLVPSLGELAKLCAEREIPLLIDGYHAVNVAPLSIQNDGLDTAFVVGGGYKYCQLGEGACFLRIPASCRARPFITGWFAEFSKLAAPRPQMVGYPEGADRYAGSTYDPTSHYRAARVFAFQDAIGLDVELLRKVSQRQIGRLIDGFQNLNLDQRDIALAQDIPLENRAGFVALRSPQSQVLQAKLRARGVWTDVRGDILRLGPAPYLSDRQLDDAITALAEAASRMD